MLGGNEASSQAQEDLKKVRGEPCAVPTSLNNFPGSAIGGRFLCFYS